jgi:hypothetical protein
VACDTGLAADILSYWHAVELFDPHGIPALPKPGAALRRKPGTECVERIRLTAEVTIPPLPWQAEHPRAGEQAAGGVHGSEWRHTVYGGIFSRADIRKSFRHALGYPAQPDFGDAEEAGHNTQEDGCERSVSAVFAFVVDKDGRLIEGSEAFSPCAWATGRLHKPGPGDPDWLAGFAEVTRECAKALRRATGLIDEAGEPDEGRVVRAPDVLSLAWRLTTMLGLPSGIARPTEMRIVSQPVDRRKDGSLPKADPPLLGSPVAPDLQRVHDAVNTPGGIGLALASYLSGPLEPENRTDLTQDRASLLAAVRPVRFPPGRWPDAGDRPLVAGQQFAVNTILDEIGDRSGLFSVNGPPGTGKSTMLRDVMAAIVVRRAEALAALPDPAAGFTEEHTWTTSDGARRSVWRPRRELTGFEMVMVSPDSREGLAQEHSVTEAEPAWGMMAAPLGDAEQQRRFQADFWSAANGMEEQLRGYERDQPPSAQWTEAVTRFVAARDRSARLMAAREAAAEALRSPIGETELRVVAKAVAEADAELARAAGEARDAAAAASDLEEAERAARHDQDEQDASRPRGLRGVFDTVHGSAKLKAWQARSEVLARQAGDAAARLAVARAVAAGARQRERTARQRSDEARRAADALTSRRERQQETLRQAVADWGDAVPVDWLDLPPAAQERSAPWSDADWLRARTEVFWSAAALHHAFITSMAPQFRHNTGHFFALLSGDPAAPPEGDAATAVWQTLFLLVPVISTTFAACGRMFEMLRREAVGWLFVDEAGRVPPQSAVGALWRSRRAVVVGDSLQLTPASRVPAELQARLRATYGVSVEWQPSAVSAQVLADRRSRWGATLRGSSGADRWAGAPLRVHRRCEEPMFGISNAIAYDGLLVYGTREVAFPGGAYPEYADSSWIDVPVSGGSGSDGLWVPAAGDALVRVIHRLHAHSGVSLGQVCVLSPFPEVASRCRALVRAEFGAAIADSLAAVCAESDAAAVGDFVDAHVGTVRTVRGRESDVVVVVLGTDPSPSKSALDWAGYRVNELNVAVSRARRRLFVIGSHDEWSAAPNFDVLAARLPRHEWAPRPW